MRPPLNFLLQKNRPYNGKLQGLFYLNKWLKYVV